jgi:hypothetical protein
MKHTKITLLTTGETIEGVDDSCLAVLQEVLKTVENERHVLLLDREGLDDLVANDCEPALVERLEKALGERPYVEVGFYTAKPTASRRITGRVRNRRDRPIGGLRVLAYDKDTMKQDDFLGCAFTDIRGRFEIGYDESDYKAKKTLFDVEGNPDIYLEVSEIRSNATKRTVTLGEAEAEEHFDLKVDMTSPTPTLRPVVGYYFIEEDKLNEEVHELSEAVKMEPNDTEAHFLLALCYIELMKAALSRAEWIDADVRSSDDALAVSANNELDIVTHQDPDRAEEVSRYREYVQKLQDLAL